MKLTQMPAQLSEMAAKKICPICNNPMSGYHYWYKGAWKCKKSSVTPPVPGAQPVAPTPSPKPSSQPRSTLDSWLTKHKIVNHVINPDGTVDVKGGVFLDEFYGTKIPVKFNTVEGDFVCAGGVLTTLVNSPTSVGGDYRVNHNALTSLEGFPTHIGGTVDISNNIDVASLDGIHDLVVGGSFHADNLRKLTSLKGISKLIKSVGGPITFQGGYVKSNILGIMMIRGVTKVDTSHGGADTILNKHIETDKDPLAAQDELIDAGAGPLAGP